MLYWTLKAVEKAAHQKRTIQEYKVLSRTIPYSVNEYLPLYYAYVLDVGSHHNSSSIPMEVQTVH